MDKKFISNIIDNEYFELPPNRLKCKMVGFLRSFVPNNIELVNPHIVICNKTGKFDKILVTNIITSNFVFLKDSVIEKIYNDDFPENKKKDLMDSFKHLKQAFVSVVIFPEFNCSIFGNSEELPQKITDFLCETNFDIKFLTLVGSFFNYPIWAPKPRISSINISQQFTIKSSFLAGLSPEEKNLAINNNMPSSATIYGSRFPVMIKSNNLAENIESIVYACPKCGTLFSVYSEYNYLKCRECGSAIEFAHNGQISLSNTIHTFDDFDEFLFNNLKNRSFSIKPIISYDNVYLMTRLTNGKIKELGQIALTIFANKIEIKTSNKTTTIKFSNIKNIKLVEDNTIIIFTKNEEFVVKGKNKENFYILFHLQKINNN